MREFYKRFLPYYPKYKLQMFFVLIGIVLVAGGSAGTAYIIQPILDEIFVNKDEELLWLMPIIIISIYMGKAFGNYIQSYFVTYIGQDIIRQIKDKMLFTMLNMDVEFFHKSRGGELISRITNDIQRIQLAVSTKIGDLIRDFFTAFGLLAIAFYQSPKLMFIAFIAFPLIIYPLSILAKKMKAVSHRSQEKTADLTSMLSEAFNNSEIIKAHSTEDYETKRFSEENKNFFKITMKAMRIHQTVPFLTETMGAVMFSAVVIFGGLEIMAGNMTVGSVFSFITALLMVYRPLKSLMSTYNNLQDAFAAGERVFYILDLEPTIISGDKQIDENINSVEVVDARLNYGEKEVLKGISLQAKKGETIALVGDSGGGKSSLVNLIIRFYDPQSGIVKFNDVDLKDLDIEHLRSKISIVTQRVFIFNDTIASNVAYGNELDEKKVIASLKLADALDFIEEMDDGIYTVLEEGGSNLSGGQRQRIAIARAVYKNPDIIILDEATSALDNKSESRVQKALEEFYKDRITFVIAHRLSTIKNANKILVFKEGKIVCEGKEDELLKGCQEFIKLSKPH